MRRLIDRLRHLNKVLSVADSSKEEIHALVEAQHVTAVLLKSLRPLRCNGLFLKTRCGKAYELSGSTMSWNDIADILGYSDRTSACRAAKNYALKNKLAWPRKTEGQGDQDH